MYVPIKKLTEEDKARIEQEIYAKMKGVKRIRITVELDMQMNQLKVQFKPRKRFDPQLLLGMLVTAHQWLLNDFVKCGKLKVIKVMDEEKSLGQNQMYT